MPLFYLHRLTGSERTERANRHLAGFLAFVAGAVNAGGFLAVHQYTSHMSGIVSAMADNQAGGSLLLVLNGLAAVLSFLLGGCFTSLLVLWGRTLALESVYALPLVAEAILLLIFGFTGRAFVARSDVLGTVLLLCFTMGLQNAIITKLSKSVIRTTHLTGMFTDSGIALGRILFAALRGGEADTSEELAALGLLLSLILLFFVGGVTGTLGFRRLGFFFTLPLALILLILAAMPVLADMRGQRPQQHGP
jgi:uncharacterized membrane protein YoaK (UPF0700 family)